ncbi:30S ribosomal protein S6 [Desulfobacca acetoxidans]|uniref:Small ribosomal subunit protein bS6 n=1 Tax=Desulfobacca acetoxidans (strain ATCC 700848 / DSM 11109 / ASRB2) TaxID=880072 RepID=F2NDS7_DESAR|nr:30S ribosomal protein S6 [Desulfobacca acetoxidans]AEB10424.1 30S ribosomal protein S6 [Desulfobacca acetoxidans DSM 11109]
MNRYETIFIINPDLGDDETHSVIDKFTGIVGAQNGVQLKLEDWGRRRLAYKIKKFHQGYYVLLDFAGVPAGLAEFERNLKIDDRILRFLSVKTGENVDVEALKAEIAAKVKPQAEAGPTPEVPEEAPAQESVAASPAVAEEIPVAVEPETSEE